jgi:hypothetical protein
MMSRGHALLLSRHRGEVPEIAIAIQTTQKVAIMPKAASPLGIAADFQIAGRSTDPAAVPHNPPKRTNRVAISGE